MARSRVVLSDVGDDPVEVVNSWISSAHARGDRSKRSARIAGSAMIVSAAAIPFVIVLSTQWWSFFLGKVVPAGLAAVAAISAGYMQVERPYERWRLFRRYERLFLIERIKFVNGAGDYGAADASTKLVERIADLALALQDEWAGIVPRSADVLSEVRR